MTQEQFENCAIAALLAGDHPVLAALREQAAAATIRCREFTGTGFFAYFEVPPSVSAILTSRLVIGDIQFGLRGAEVPAEAIVHVRNGRLATLEGYLYGDSWPGEPVIEWASYFGGAQYPSVGNALFESRNVAHALAQPRALVSKPPN